MTSRHITMEYPAKQIQLEPLPLIYCRSILLFLFFFPSELEINNSAGNCSVLVANSLTSHPISFSPSLSPFLSLLSSLCLMFSTLLLSASFVSTCVCLLCVYVHLHPEIFLHACVGGDSPLSCTHSTPSFLLPFPFFPSFPLSSFPLFYPRPSDAERGGSHMISTDDLEYPREYRTLGNSARRFSNVGLVHTSEHRHTVSAAQSLEALTNLHKADMERKRDAFMDHLKSKYQQQQQLQHPHHSPHHNPPSPSPSHASMRGTSERSAREQVRSSPPHEDVIVKLMVIY